MWMSAGLLYVPLIDLFVVSAAHFASLMGNMGQILALEFDCWIKKPCYRQKTPLLINGTRIHVLADSMAIPAIMYMMCSVWNSDFRYLNMIWSYTWIHGTKLIYWLFSTVKWINKHSENGQCKVSIIYCFYLFGNLCLHCTFYPRSLTRVHA